MNPDASFAFSADEQSTLMDSNQPNYNQFLFAVSREVEFQQKWDLAAALYSQVNSGDDYYSTGVNWKSGTGKNTLGSDYYYSWFFYLDAEYTPQQVQSVIDFALEKSTENTEFNRWQREHLKENVDRLYDLIGTKYIRQNNMSQALVAFQKVDAGLWDSEPYSMYLNGNPFHADFYSSDKRSRMDTIS